MGGDQDQNWKNVHLTMITDVATYNRQKRQNIAHKLSVKGFLFSLNVYRKCRVLVQYVYTEYTSIDKLQLKTIVFRAVYHKTSTKADFLLQNSSRLEKVLGV